MIDVELGYPFYPGLDGLPLQFGSIYYGAAGQNPTTSPITVYWDAAGTQPAAQPISVKNGRPVNNGAAARVFVSGDYSKLVLDSRGRQVLYEPTQSSRNLAGLPFTQSSVSSVPRDAQDKMRDSVHVKDFGAIGDGAVHLLSSVYATLAAAQAKYPFATTLSHTLDYCAIQAALNTGQNVDLGSLDLLIDTACTSAKKGQRIFGRGMGAGGVTGDSITRIRATGDIEYFRVSGAYVRFENILVDTPLVPHTKPHIRFINGADSGEVWRCRVNGSGSDGGAGPGITFDDGAGGVGTAVIGLVTDSYVVHASVIVRIPDVKVRGGYVWSLSKQYGIGVFNGVSNFTADTVDIVPPLSTTAGKKAGVYVSGASVNPMLVDCYLDGNPSLNTGKAVLFENGCLAPSVIGGKANLCDDDVITFDSVIAPVVDGVTFYNNNQQGTGASDIVLTNTFAQLLEKPRVVGTSHIQSAAGVGTRGAAVKVAAGCARRGIEIAASIHQPGTGGGYVDTEILLEDGAFLSDNEGTLRGSRGTRTQYKGSANTAYIVGDTFKTISWPATMAYVPRFDQVRVVLQNTFGSGATPVRVQSATTGNVGIGFVSGGAPTTGTLYAAAEL